MNWSKTFIVFAESPLKKIVPLSGWASSGVEKVLDVPERNVDC